MYLVYEANNIMLLSIEYCKQRQPLYGSIFNALSIGDEGGCNVKLLSMGRFLMFGRRAVSVFRMVDSIIIIII